MRFFEETEVGWQPYLSPSTIEAKVNQVSEQVLAFNRDVRDYLAASKNKTGGVPENVFRFAKSWSTYIEDFNNWYGGKPSKYWGTTYSQAEDYERQLSKFWEAFSRLGGKPTMDKPTPPPADAMARYMPLLYLGVGVAGLWALSKIIGSVASTGAFDKEKRE
jgi:hypothetical protein